MEILLQDIAVKKAELDRLRPLAPNGLTNLEHSHGIELTTPFKPLVSKPGKVRIKHTLPSA